MHLMEIPMRNTIYLIRSPMRNTMHPIGIAMELAMESIRLPVVSHGTSHTASSIHMGSHGTSHGASHWKPYGIHGILVPHKNMGRPAERPIGFHGKPHGMSCAILHGELCEISREKSATPRDLPGSNETP